MNIGISSDCIDQIPPAGKQCYVKPTITALSSHHTEGGKVMALMFEVTGPITMIMYGPS